MAVAKAAKAVAKNETMSATVEDYPEGSRSLIDSLLMEMPRYVIPSTLGKRRDLDEPNIFSPGKSDDDYRISPIIERAGDQPEGQLTLISVRPYHAAHGYSTVDIPVKPPIPAFGFNTYGLAHNSWLTTPFGKKIRRQFNDEIEAAKKKIRDRFEANRKRLRKTRSFEVPVERPETIRLGSGHSPISMMRQVGFNKKFRWASGGQNPSSRSDTIIAFLKQARSDDKIIKLIADDEDRNAVYVLLNPKEEEEFRRMVTMRARRQVGKLLGDSVLTEMARYKFSREDEEDDKKPKITYELRADAYARVFTCRATAKTSGGEREIFVASEPMSEEDRAIVFNEESTTGGRKRLEHIFKDVFKRVFDTAIKEAKDFLNKADQDPVEMVNDIESFKAKGPLVYILKDFRYFRAYTSVFGFGREALDEISKFLENRQPGDKLVRVEDSRESRETNVENKVSIYYYVLVNPSELADLRRRLVLRNREQVNKLLDEE